MEWENRATSPGFFFHLLPFWTECNDTEKNAANGEARQQLNFMSAKYHVQLSSSQDAGKMRSACFPTDSFQNPTTTILNIYIFYLAYAWTNRINRVTELFTL